MAKKIEAKEPESIRKPSDEEMVMSFSGPAYAVNRCVVSISTGGVVRITFAEQHNPDMKPVFRTAVALAIQDALNLRNVLIGVLKAPEAAIEKAKEEQKAT